VVADEVAVLEAELVLNSELELDLLGHFRGYLEGLRVVQVGEVGESEGLDWLGGFDYLLLGVGDAFLPGVELELDSADPDLVAVGQDDVGGYSKAVEGGAVGRLQVP